MKLTEFASTGATASGGIATVNASQSNKPIKRDIYGDITLEDLDFDPDAEAGGGTSFKEYNTMELYKALVPFTQGGEPEAEYIDMLQHVLLADKHHTGHHNRKQINAAEFKNLLTHWRVTPRDFGLSDNEVADLLHNVLQQIGYGQLLTSLDGATFGGDSE